MTFLRFLYRQMQDVYRIRGLILQLTKRDIQFRYLGSYLGTLWAFIQPTVNIIILWFVFQIGFKTRPLDNFPFVLWLVAGMVPWIFFSDSIANATGALIDSSYLVKKIVFPVGVLPIIKIFSSLFIHLFFIIVLFIMFCLYGYKPTIYEFQVLYYLFATIALVIGVSWITSALIVFLRDVGQIVAMILQFAYWLTPIFWSAKNLPEKYQVVLKLNPAYYLVEGYRDTFIYHEWFWQHGHMSLYFWVFTILLMVLGALTFNRLRPHFADVL